MTKKDIAEEIAKDMLNNDMLDEHNYNFDTEAILEDVKNMIMGHLKDYTIIAGTVVN